jgi:transcriptional regulator GlxA family with amidase domain
MNNAQHARAGSDSKSHLFHKVTGVTFTIYVQSLRVKEAKYLVAETDNSITAVCFGASEVMIESRLDQSQVPKLECLK